MIPMAFNPLSWLGPVALPRLTLLLNHVVSSEPVAASKLQPFAGRTIDIVWASSFAPRWPGLAGRSTSAQPWLPPALKLVVTPAGLFEAASENSAAPSGPGLTLTVQLPAPLTLVSQLVRGQRPEVGIEGDAALAEAAAWLMKHLRWDIQDDLARWLGNTPAEVLRNVGDGIRQSLQRWRPAGGSDNTTRASR